MIVGESFSVILRKALDGLFGDINQLFSFGLSSSFQVIGVDSSHSYLSS